MTALVTENLPLLAAAPNGINQLRSLILDLAIRGKLVPQSLADEPAEALLERIRAARLAAAASRKARTESSQSAEASYDDHFELPAGWLWTTLATVSLINPRNVAPDDLSVSFVPMASIGAKFDSGHTQELRRWSEVKQGFTHFAEGDIGVAKITPCFENSKACVFTGLTNGIGAGTTELHIVRPCAGTLAPRYVLAYLKSPWFLVTGESRMTGTAGQKRLPKEFVERHPFPLPPLEEQHRIVAKVEELMALCDRLEAEQDDAAAAHAKLVEALLASLNQARDAAEFRDGWQQLAEHFHALFTTEASVEALKKSVMQLGVEGRLCTGAARSTWRLRTINEFCTVQGGIQKTPLRAPAKHHFPYLRVANVQRGRIDIAQLERYELAMEELQRWRLNAGDLLIVEGNGSESEIGRCAIWHGEVDDCVYQNHLMRVRPTGDDAVDYLALYLNSPIGTAHMRRLAITTSGLFNLSVGKIRSIPVELPPPAEQHLIVAKVRELLACCDQLKAGLGQARQHHEHLASVLVEQAVASAIRPLHGQAC
ncbi:restriction endonuclease subunit S [Roseateles chitinivorans]|uniref:restriction endonuclease subunit S n=1 Tax=Roseateles chitinivorans TaxID=2917965 RepID=UPI003D678A4D